MILNHMGIKEIRDLEKYMEMALEQARQAFDREEFPVGCVIVQSGHVIASGSRAGTGPGQTFFSEVDHAEVRALKNLEKFKGGFDPEESILFSTMEPCLMCYGAILLSGIKTIVYAYEDAMGGGTGCDLNSLTPLYRDRGVEVIKGVCREKSLDLFYQFFNKEGNQYWKGSFLESYTLEQKQNQESKKALAPPGLN